MGSTAEITAALAAVPDEELRSLRAGLPGEEVVAPGFIAWLEAAADWEMGRRAGRQCTFPDLRSADDDTEVECGLIALAILHASFDDDACMAHLLDATAALLCAAAHAAPARPS